MAFPHRQSIVIPFPFPFGPGLYGVKFGDCAKVTNQERLSHRMSCQIYPMVLNVPISLFH